MANADKALSGQNKRFRKLFKREMKKGAAFDRDIERRLNEADKRAVKTVSNTDRVVEKRLDGTVKLLETRADESKYMMADVKDMIMELQLEAENTLESAAKSTDKLMWTNDPREPGLNPAMDQSERQEEYALANAYRKLEESEDSGLVAISEASEKILD